MIKNEQLQCISTDEYFYLTENFEFVDAKTMEKNVRYFMYNKKRKLLDIVRSVIENELTEKERKIAWDYWWYKISIGDISEKHHISRSSLYRTIDAIKKKLDVSLKYVLLYDSAIKPPSTEEFLSLIKKDFYMGEQFEN